MTVRRTLAFLLISSCLPPAAHAGMGPSKQSAEVPAPSPLLRQFEDDLRDPMTAQRETLQEILSKASSTSALRKYDFTAGTTLEEYVDRHPLTDYDDYEDLIDSVANGDVDPTELVGSDPNERLLSLVVTSGTSRGKNKLVPWTSLDLESRGRFFGLMDEIKRRHGLPGMFSGKTLTTMQKGTVLRTPSGLIAAGPLSQALDDEAQRKAMQSTMVSPTEICVLDSSHRIAIYAHLLSGLIKREEVTSLRTNNANEALEMFLMLEREWETVIEHLRFGVETTADGLVDDDSYAILKPLVGDGIPELADVVERECRKGFDGILPRLFPNCEHIFTVTSGTMIPYAAKLRVYAGENVPIVSSFYGASEGIVGLNTDPLSKEGSSGSVPLYTLSPRSSVFEFIPFPEGGRPVNLDQVTIGASYEVVVTSRNCMYRYKLGDVVKVAKMEQNTPVLEFLHRKGATLALTANDIVTEKQLLDAVSRAEEQCGKAIASECVFDADRDCLPPRYVMYFELKQDGAASTEEIESFAAAFDRALCDRNGFYRGMRDREEVGRARLILVDGGTFLRHRDDALKRGTDPSQYKIPRCVNGPSFRELLRGAIKETYS